MPHPAARRRLPCQMHGLRLGRRDKSGNWHQHPVDDPDRKPPGHNAALPAGPVDGANGKAPATGLQIGQDGPAGGGRTLVAGDTRAACRDQPAGNARVMVELPGKMAFTPQTAELVALGCLQRHAARQRQLACRIAR